MFHSIAFIFEFYIIFLKELVETVLSSEGKALKGTGKEKKKLADYKLQQISLFLIHIVSKGEIISRGERAFKTSNFF